MDTRTIRIVSLILTVAGGLFIGIGGAFYVRAWTTHGTTSETRAQTAAVCTSVLGTMGEVARTASGGLRLMVPEVPDPRSRMADASAVLAACPEWTMTYFCMGQRCAEGERVSMILELAAPTP